MWVGCPGRATGEGAAGAEGEVLSSPPFPCSQPAACMSTSTPLLLAGWVKKRLSAYRRELFMLSFLFRLQIFVAQLFAGQVDVRSLVLGAPVPSPRSAVQKVPLFRPCHPAGVADSGISSITDCQGKVALGVLGVPAAGSAWCQRPLAPLPPASSSHPAAGGPWSPSLLCSGTAFLKSSDTRLLAFVLQ